MQVRGDKSFVVIGLSVLAAACSPAPEVTDAVRPAAATPPVPSAAGDQSRVAKAVARLSEERPPPQLEETRARRGSIDRAGDVHVIFDGFRKGRRVLGAEVVRHLLADDTVEIQNGDENLTAATFDDTPPAIDEARAASAARESMKPLAARVDATYPDLIYERAGAVYKLVYRVDVAMNPRETEAQEWRVWIDPKDGTVLRRLDVTQHAVGVGHSHLYGTVPLQTFYYPENPDERSQWGFTLEDWLRPKLGSFIRTSSFYDARGFAAELPEEFYDADNDWGNGADLSAATMADAGAGVGPLSPTGQTAAVDAHNSAAWAWDLYVDVFQRFGPFGDGTVFDNVVHYPHSSAFNIRARTMYIGMGWSKTCPAQADLSIVGHEIAHGFFTSRIVDSTYAGETGGINEANSDIIGKLTDIYGQGGMAAGGAHVPLPQSWPMWNMLICGRVLRSMYRPSWDGASYDAWSPAIEATAADAHYASGPINRMFYFLATGVEDQTHVIIGGGESSSYLPTGLLGIGIPAAADVYYRAVAGWLRPKDPKFADLRVAMERAAGTDTTVKKAVQDAFAAINVGPKADRIGPSISGVTTLAAPGGAVTAMATDPTGVKSVSFASSAGSWGTALVSPWSVNVPTDVTTGSYPLQVCAIDKLDNRTCTTTTIAIDADGPVIGLFEVTNPLVAGNKTAHLMATDRRIDSASVYLGTSRLFYKDYSSASITQPTTSIDLTPTLVLPPGLADGTHTLEARVQDELGLLRTKTTTFLRDTVPPHRCELVDLKLAYKPSAALNALTSDLTSGIKSIDFTFDGVPTTTYPTLNRAPNTIYVAGTSWSNRPLGQHSVGVTCKDQFGLASSASTTVTISNPPNGSITGLGQAATPTRSFTYRVRVTDSDGLGWVHSAVVCASSGWHNVTPSLVGNPAVYDKTFTVNNLILNESCTAQLSAEDRFGLSMTPQSLDFIVQNPPPPPSMNACNTAVHSGANAPATYTVDLGAKSGRFDFMRSTYNVADLMTLSCADGGTVNGYPSYSPGCESTADWVTTTLSFNCTSTKMKVAVSPNCAGVANTLWDFSLGCAY